jgi:TolA-binding protein
MKQAQSIRMIIGTGIAISLFSFSLTGCLKTRSELGDTDEKKAAQTQVQKLQTQKADADAQIISLEAQIRNLNGRIETLEHEQEQSAKAREENSQKIQAFESRVKLLEDAILELKGEFDSSKVTPPPAPKKTDKGLFEEGEDLYSEKEWKKAIAAYQKYRETNPKGEHLPAATYKIGVSLQELKMNKEAKVFLEEVIEKWPKSKPARAASFRLNQLKKK